jgi:hypothetical protein
LSVFFCLMENRGTIRLSKHLDRKMRAEISDRWTSDIVLLDRF